MREGFRLRIVHTRMTDEEAGHVASFAPVETRPPRAGEDAGEDGIEAFWFGGFTDIITGIVASRTQELCHREVTSSEPRVKIFRPFGGFRAVLNPYRGG